MGGKKKYINIFGSFTDPFNCICVLKKLTSSPLGLPHSKPTTIHKFIWCIKNRPLIFLR